MTAGVAAGGVAAGAAAVAGAAVGAAAAGGGAGGAGGGSAGFAATGAGAGAEMVALTAVLQPGARSATFFCRHCSASLPPGVTPLHFAMKSERQLARMALCCSGVTCATALLVKAAKAIAAAASAPSLPGYILGNVMASPTFRRNGRYYSL